MEIEVYEGYIMDGGEVKIKAIIDCKRFIELYGMQDYNILLRDGSIGDVIGEKRWYYARILMDDSYI